MVLKSQNFNRHWKEIPGAESVARCIGLWDLGLGQNPFFATSGSVNLEYFSLEDSIS